MQIIGIDININSLIKARDSYSNNFYSNGDIQNLPYKDSAFDFIFSFSVLQYVDWKTTLNECNRVLKPGGKAVFIENQQGNVLALGFRAIHSLFRWKYAPNQSPKQHLKNDELQYIDKIFEEVEIIPFHLTTPLLLILPALKNRIFRIPWSISLPWLFPRLFKIDNWIKNRHSKFNKYYWHSVIFVTKSGSIT